MARSRPTRSQVWLKGRARSSSGSKNSPGEVNGPVGCSGRVWWPRRSGITEPIPFELGYWWGLVGQQLRDLDVAAVGAVNADVAGLYAFPARKAAGAPVSTLGSAASKADGAAPSADGAVGRMESGQSPAGGSEPGREAAGAGQRR